MARASLWWIVAILGTILLYNRGKQPDREECTPPSQLLWESAIDKALREAENFPVREHEIWI
jgi:hypothetical protein